jgi:acetylornithine deacetylase/succinyl-diaminopimelate desuccinylase-like protein
MAETVLGLFKAVGIENATLQEVPTGYPPIYGTLDGPVGSPTVMLYAHYDVQPAPPEQGWTSDPWTPTKKDDGRVYGRGAADDKGGLAIHLGTLRYFDGSPPCTIKVIFEGMEETNSNLEAFVEAHPELFACDLFVVCDMGNLEVGEPTLTTTLRGDVACIVTVKTLEHPLHSGVFGGPVPDAMMALAQLLATLHDENGDVAVKGVSSFEWDGMDFSEQDLRAGADMLDGAEVVGTGSVGSRLWSHPSISAIGIDITSIDGSSNVLLPVAKAKLSMRIVPGSDPKTELDALVKHLETHAPWGATVEVERTKEAPPFRCETGGPGYAAARVALEEAYGSAPGEAGSGGSIPLLRTLQQAAPNAEFILWGPEDVAKSRIHASDESVDPSEIEKMIVAQIRLLEHLAAKG